MSAWKVGGSKVFKGGAKDTVGMIKYTASQNLGAYQITTPFNNNHSDKNMQQILNDAEKNNIAVGFHAVNYTAHVASKDFFYQENRKHWENTVVYSHKYNIPAVVHIEAKYWKDREKQLYSVCDRLEMLINDLGANPEYFYLEVSGERNNFSENFMDLYALSGVLNTRICVDWAHLYATLQERFTQAIVEKVVTLLEATTWKNEQWHHISGIVYNERGEEKHIRLEESAFPYKMVCEVLKASNLTGVMITESGYENAHDSKLIQSLLK